MRASLLIMVALLGCDGSLAPTPEPVRLPVHALPLPAGVPRQRRSKRAELAGEPHLLYANFDGGMMRGATNCSQSTVNCSFIIGCPGIINYPAYTGSMEERQETLRILRRYFSPYNIEVVEQRPMVAHYSMAVIGGRPTDICYTPAGGVAPMDCDNSNENDISFTFSASAGNNPAYVAAVIAQEHAHSYGLEHVDNVHDALHPSNLSDTWGYLNQSMGVVKLNTNGSLMPVMSQCDPNSMTQNSHERMRAAAGDGPPDTVAPTVKIVSPADGLAGFHHDRDIRVTVSVDDNFPLEGIAGLSLQGVELVVDEGQPEEQRMMQPMAPYQWSTRLSGGAHVLKAIGTDAAGNKGESLPVHIMVTPPDAAAPPDAPADAAVAADAGTSTGRRGHATGEAPVDEPPGGCASAPLGRRR